MKYLILSGRQDSNLRPPGPKPGAMTGLRYAPNLSVFAKRCGETGTRTQATVTRRQISNLLRYHSGTSPFMYMNLLFLFCGCKGITIFYFLQVFRKLFLIFFIKYLVNSYLSNTQYLYIFVLERIYHLFFYAFSLPKLYFVIYFILNVEDTKQQGEIPISKLYNFTLLFNLFL